MEHLTIIERAVVELIPRGRERRTTTREIGKLVDLDSREVFAVIQQARRKGVPIVASRRDNGGLFIATNEEERSEGLRPLEAQYESTRETIENIRGADLNNWQKLLA